MSYDGGFRKDRITHEVKLEFDASSKGGRRSLIWNASAAQDFSARFKGMTAVDHPTENDLHSFVASDLNLQLDNTRLSDAQVYGYWDSSTLTTDLGAVLGVLGRVSLRVLDETGAWTAWTPVYSGVIEDLSTTNTEGIAEMTLRGVHSILANEPAEDVKNGDSWYQQLPITRAVKLLLTQKDRWAPIFGGNIGATVSARSSSSITLTIGSGAWGQDDTGAHPYGVLYGYAIEILTGTAAGKVYTVTSNTGGGTTSAVCQVTGNPSSDGVAASDSVRVTGYCWPYLESELSSFTIQPVFSIPTYDGRREISRFGRPPEDASTGITRALAHDGTYLWLGVGNKVYRYDEATDTYTLFATLTPSTLIFRRGFWSAAQGYIYLQAWADSTTSAVRTAYVFRIRAADTPGAAWTTGSAVGTLSNLWPGDKQRRIGRRLTYQTRQVGYTYSDPLITCPWPQAVYPVDSDGTTDTWYGLIGISPFQFGNGSIAGPPFVTTAPWSYLAVGGTDNAGAVPWFSPETYIGGSYQIFYEAANDAIYYWALNTGTKILELKRFNCGAHTSTAISALAQQYQCPGGTWSNGTYIYVVVNDYGSDVGLGDLPVMYCKRTDLNGSGGVVQWESDAQFPYTYLLFTGGTGQASLNGVGCIMAPDAFPPDGQANSPWHQKFILVKGLETTTFWSNFKTGAATLYTSRSCFHSFATNPQDGRAWFLQHGSNRLWHAYNSTAGLASESPTVPSDSAAASQLCFSPETYWRVFGVSAGQFLDLTPASGQPSGLYWLWQFSYRFSPRVDLAAWKGLSRLEALRKLAQLANYICRWDESGLFRFVKRVNPTPTTWTLANDSTLGTVRKLRARNEVYNRVSIEPTIPTYKAPDVTFRASRVDGDGNPVAGQVFNGGITVRQADTATKRLKLICVVGNFATYGGRDSTPPVTGTAWQIFNATANPQYANGGAAVYYPGGWWEPGGHRIFIQLEDAQATDSTTPVGFSPGDVIEISCPGVEAESAPERKITVEDGAQIASTRERVLPLDNVLAAPERARDLAYTYLQYFKPAMRGFEIESELFPSYKPLDSMSLTSARLNVSGVVGLILKTQHNVLDTPKTSLTFREWPTVSDPTPASMPNATLPASEPNDQGGQGGPPPETGPLELIWQYLLPDLMFSTPEITDGDGDGVPEIYILNWDNTVRCLNPDGTLRWAWNPNTGSGADNCYGYVCAVDVDGDGRKEIIYGSHDSYVRCLKIDANNTVTVLWSFRDWYHRNSLTEPWQAETLFQNGPTFATRTISGTPTLCLFQTGFDGRVLCVRASDGSILWEAKTDGIVYTDPDFWRWNSDIETAPAVKDIDGDGQPEIVTVVRNGLITWDDTGPSATGYPDTGKWAYWFDYNSSAAAIADVDGDGLDEIVVNGGTWTGLPDWRIYVLSRTGVLKAYKSILGGSDSLPAIADIDNDGNKEIVFATEAGYVYCLRWQSGALETVWIKRVSIHPINSSPCILNIGTDNTRQVIIGLDDSKFVVLSPLTGDTIQEVTLPSASSIEGTIVGGDIDGDGKIEILVPAREGQALLCYRANQSTATSTRWFRRYGWSTGRTGEQVLPDV